MDIRKKFFYSIIQSGGKSTKDTINKEQAISELKKRSRSESDLDQSVEGNDDILHNGKPDDAEEIVRPRSASPTVGTQIWDQEKDSKNDEKFSDTKGSDTDDKEGGDRCSPGMKDSAATLKSSQTLQDHRSEDIDREFKSDREIPPPSKSNSLDYDVGESAKMKTTFIGSRVPEEEEEEEEKGDRPVEATGIQSTRQGKCRPYVDIPEFIWSSLHQRLLSELLFAIESDMQVWKT